MFIACLGFVLRHQVYDYDWWYYAGHVRVYEGAHFGPPGGSSPGHLGEGHDIALILSRGLIHIGNFALPLFFTVFFVVAGWFMLRPMVKFPELIFLIAPFSLALQIMFGTYYLYAQLMAMSFFFLAIGLYLKGRKLPVTICLILMGFTHSWTALFYAAIFGIYLLVRDRKFFFPYFIWSWVFAFSVPAYVFSGLVANPLIGSNLSYVWGTQLAESYMLLPFLVIGIISIWKLRMRLLFVMMIAFPLAILAFSFSTFWSYRVLSLVPFLPLEAIGLSKLAEWMGRFKLPQ